MCIWKKNPLILTTGIYFRDYLSKKKVQTFFGIWIKTWQQFGAYQYSEKKLFLDIPQTVKPKNALFQSRNSIMAYAERIWVRRAGLPQKCVLFGQKCSSGKKSHGKKQWALRHAQCRKNHHAQRPPPSVKTTIDIKTISPLNPSFLYFPNIKASLTFRANLDRFPYGPITSNSKAKPAHKPVTPVRIIPCESCLYQLTTDKKAIIRFPAKRPSQSQPQGPWHTLHRPQSNTQLHISGRRNLHFVLTLGEKPPSPPKLWRAADVFGGASSRGRTANIRHLYLLQCCQVVQSVNICQRSFRKLIGKKGANFCSLKKKKKNLFIC